MTKEFETLKNFYLKEKNFLEYLQERWIDEWEYEDEEEYEEVIKQKANKYYLFVSKVKLNYNNLSLKITFNFDNKRKGFIELLQTKNKVYMKG